MSPLLAVAILLLVILGGLAWFQRRATRDLSTRPGQASGATTPAAGPAGPPERVRPTLVTDPVFGDLTFNGTDTWTRDDDLSLAGEYIEVLVMADAEGPQDMHRAWMQAALARFDALDAEARTVLAGVLAPLGLSRADLTPWQISIGPIDDETVFEGRVGYDSMHELVDEAYVRSTAMWDHLEPHVTLEGGEEEHGPAHRGHGPGAHGPAAPRRERALHRKLVLRLARPGGRPLRRVVTRSLGDPLARTRVRERR